MNGKITKPKLITKHMAENIIKAAPKQKIYLYLQKSGTRIWLPKNLNTIKNIIKNLYSDLVKGLENRESQLQVRI